MKYSGMIMPKPKSCIAVHQSKGLPLSVRIEGNAKKVIHDICGKTHNQSGLLDMIFPTQIKIIAVSNVPLN
jgi:hypothetical protein